MGLLDFIERGPERTEWLSDTIGGAVEYLTPPNLRPVVEMAAQFNPIQGMSDSMSQFGVAVDPSRSMDERRAAALGSAVEGLLAVVPAAMASQGYMKPAQATMEGLLGGSPAAQQIGDDLGQFWADEAGALRLGRLNDAEAMARDILDLRAAGRASEVTDDMMAKADPSYMFNNTPLDMSQEARMARADEMGFDTGTTWSHGGFGISDATSFDPRYAGDTTANNDYGLFHFADDRDVAEDYARQSFIRRYQDYPEGLIDDGVVASTPDLSDYEVAYPYVEELAEDNLQVMDVFARSENPMRLNMAGDRVDLQQLEEMRGAVAGQGDLFEYEHLLDGPIYKFPESDYTEFRDEIAEFARDSLGMDAEVMDAYDWKQAGDEYLMEMGYEPDLNVPDSIRVDRMVDDIGERSNTVANQLIIRDPNALRSRFARFDPEFKHLANLSAGLGGIGLLGSINRDDLDRDTAAYLGGI